MTQSHISDLAPTTKRSLPIAGKKNETLDVDAELSRFEAEERERLGLEGEKQWLEQMANLTFTKSEKAGITLLIGGLTAAQDFLTEGALKGLGYNVHYFGMSDNAGLQTGKEFGNRGQCNPTYFTVGGLVKHLIALRDDKGMSKKDIIDKFVFLTAGACGPCRFGMYVTEYRKALRDAGFDGFRVMLFQQQGGLSQATGEESGLELNPQFFIGLLKGLLAGDVINGIAYRLRPYEVVKGATDAAVAQAKKICYDALYEKRSILWALHQSRKIFEKVEVDRTIPKPKVAIIGEFWAMTTEGDGNYQLQRFLEQEGAECDIQFVTAWLLYNVWEVRFDTKTRMGLRGKDKAKAGLDGTNDFHAFKMKASLWAADKAIRVAFQTFANVAGFYGYHLADMDEVADVAAPFYNNDLRGGEGHMEVGKLILNVVKSKATMTLSVKPFGCMPSGSVSDGVQSLITERYPGTIFCAVETSGDGAVNFQSRVQMYLFKARQAATEDFAQALEKTGMTVEKLRAFLKANPKYAAGLHKAPHYAASTPADLVHEVAEIVDLTPSGRALYRARKVANEALEFATRTLKGAPETTRSAAVLLAQAASELAEIAKEKAPGLAESAVSAARERLGKILPFAAPAKAEGPLASAAE